MILKLLVAALLLAPVLTACTERFRDPCGYVRSTTTTMRTKNKALGWVPSSTIYFDSPIEPRVVEKC